MDHNYEWIFTFPKKKLLVNMKNFKNKKKVFEATLKLNREKFTLKNLLLHTFRFPFITLRIVINIHWQALKLWFRGATFYIHPNKIKLEESDNEK